jgi:hypothetical protein
VPKNPANPNIEYVLIHDHAQILKLGEEPTLLVPRDTVVRILKDSGQHGIGSKGIEFVVVGGDGTVYETQYGWLFAENNFTNLSNLAQARDAQERARKEQDIARRWIDSVFTVYGPQERWTAAIEREKAEDARRRSKPVTNLDHHEERPND